MRAVEIESAPRGFKASVYFGLFFFGDFLFPAWGRSR